MTPSQIYAQKRRQAIILIRRYTPDDELHDALIERIRPAIAFDSKRADDAQIPLGASKFGGAPDVPDSFEIPRYQGRPGAFIAQINLDEIAPLDIEGALPKSGVLSCFFSIESLDNEIITANVFHFPAVSQRLAVAAQDLDFKMVTLTPQIIASPLNATNAEFYQETGEPILRGRAAAYDVPDEIALEFPAYQMLGHPYCVQNDPRFNSSHVAGEDWRDWRLLLAIDGDPQARSEWGDSGMIYWTIRTDDLKRGDFTNCRFHFDTC